MSIPIAIILILYAVFLLAYLIFFFFNIYHMFRFGVYSFFTYFIAFVYIAGTIIILFLSWQTLASFDWSAPISFTGSNIDIFDL